MPAPSLPSAHLSFFHRVFGRSVAPLWTLRIFTIAAIVPLLLAMFLWKAGNAHDFCIGLSVGVLLGLLLQTFAIGSVELRNDPQPSDVDDLRLTR